MADHINVREAEPMQMAGLWSCIYDVMHCNREVSSMLNPISSSKVSFLTADCIFQLLVTLSRLLVNRFCPPIQVCDCWLTGGQDFVLLFIVCITWEYSSIRVSNDCCATSEGGQRMEVIQQGQTGRQHWRCEASTAAPVPSMHSGEHYLLKQPIYMVYVAEQLCVAMNCCSCY